MKMLKKFTLATLCECLKYFFIKQESLEWKCCS